MRTAASGRSTRSPRRAISIAAGWTLAADGTRHKGNQLLSFTMVYPTGGNSVLPATVAALLEQLHIHVDQKPLTTALLYETAAAGGIMATDPDVSLGVRGLAARYRFLRV